LRGGALVGEERIQPPLGQLVLVHGGAKLGVRVEVEAGLDALLEPLAGAGAIAGKQASLARVVVGLAELFEVVLGNGGGNQLVGAELTSQAAEDLAQPGGVLDVAPGGIQEVLRLTLPALPCAP